MVEVLCALTPIIGNKELQETNPIIATVREGIGKIYRSLIVYSLRNHFRLRTRFFNSKLKSNDLLHHRFSNWTMARPENYTEFDKKSKLMKMYDSDAMIPSTSCHIWSESHLQKITSIFS